MNGSGFGEQNLNSIESGIPGFKFAGGNIGDILSAVIPIIFFIAGVLLLVKLIASGFALMTAAGDPKKTAGAKSSLTNAFLGIIIVIVAFFIVQAIGLAFGLTPITSVFRSGP